MINLLEVQITENEKQQEGRQHQPTMNDIVTAFFVQENQ